jgi:hypothetical protein
VKVNKAKKKGNERDTRAPSLFGFFAFAVVFFVMLEHLQGIGDLTSIYINERKQ